MFNLSASCVQATTLQTMSRSKKKEAVGYIANCKSRKSDKQACNRLFRRTSNRLIKQSLNPPKYLREVMDRWNFAGDAKWRYSPDNPYYTVVLRK